MCHHLNTPVVLVANVAIVGPCLLRLWWWLQEREISPNDMVVTHVEQRRLHLSEVMAAKEVFLVGSSVRVVPIVR